MRILLFASLAFIFLLGTPVLGQYSPRITGFQVFLFNSKTGTFSQDMLAKGAPEMGNVPASEFASSSTFVSVRIDFGPHSSAPRNLKLHLTATESGSLPFAENGSRTKVRRRLILDSFGDLGSVDGDGVTYVGFWLSETGCRAIDLKAQLVGWKNEVVARTTLPFACYE